MTDTADHQTPPPPTEPPDRRDHLLLTLAATMGFIAVIDITANTLWPHTAHWVDLAATVLTPLLTEIITQIHNHHR